MKFLSNEWLGQYEPLAGSIFAVGRTPTGISAKVMESYKNVPGQDGKDVWLTYEWEDGVLVEQAHGTGLETAPRDADFSFLIDLSLPKKLLGGELKPDEIMTSGAFDARLNFVKFMPVERPFIYMQVLKAILEMKLPAGRNAAMDSFRLMTRHVRKGLVKRGVALQ